MLWKVEADLERIGVIHLFGVLGMMARALGNKNDLVNPGVNLNILLYKFVNHIKFIYYSTEAKIL